jgi:hypothetical protein
MSDRHHFSIFDIHKKQQQHANKLTVKLTANDEKHFSPTAHLNLLVVLLLPRHFKHRNYCLIAHQWGSSREGRSGAADGGMKSIQLAF